MSLDVTLDVFLKPRSVAVIGATERPGSWGSFIMEGLIAREFPGRLFPVNRKGGQVYGRPAYKDVRQIEEPVELAVLAIPEEGVEEAVEACGEKGVQGVTIITAGFGEAVAGGRDRELALARRARARGMRLLGPNVSGTFNLHARFNAAASPAEHLRPSTLAAVCQGGYAFYDLLASAFSRKMGVGKFVHTGNECDLTVTDFLEYYGRDPEVEGVLMYLETVRDGRRFLEVASRVARQKPVVVYKAGRTTGGARAARSHTGALAGPRALYRGLLEQAGIVLSPTMELLVPLGHHLLERPPMRGRRVAIVTVGGSWGVSLTDTLEEAGLVVPELSGPLQQTLRSLGMPVRASTRNPIDIGAAGMLITVETLLPLARAVLSSGEVDALVLHGLGRPGMTDQNMPGRMKIYLMLNKQVMQAFAGLEREIGRPVLIGNHLSPFESQVVHDLNEEGIRIINRLDEIAQLLFLMYDFWLRRGRVGETHV